MQFSIIIPVYNVEQYLCDCLDSVLAQNFTDYEAICVNDGSADNSLSVLEEYAQKSDKIKIISQKNKGLSGARNTGIMEAKGDYIFFLDSDDRIESNTLDILKKELSDEDILSFNGQRWFESTETKEEPNPGIKEDTLTGWEYYNKYALVGRKIHFLPVWQRVYKKEFIFQNNLFFKEGIYHEDNLFTPIACYYAKKVKVIPDVLYFYRIRQGSIMQQNDFKRLKDIIQIANSLADFFIPININKQIIYREIAGEYFNGFTAGNKAIYGNVDKVLGKIINWDYFKTVATYPRHKRICFLLKIHPILFRIYMKLEQIVKILK